MWLSFLRFTRYWKLLTLRKFLYFPRILPPHERRILLFLACIIVISGVGALTRIYLRITVPVPNVGKSYREGLFKEPRTINPIFAAEDAERDIARLVFSGLFTYTGEGKLAPDLAKELQISDDGRIYTILLRDTIQWHDGKPVTADDVIFTIKTIQNPQYKSILRANWQGVDVQTLNERTIRFSLKTAYVPFVENLTVGILPKHLWEGISPEKAPLHELNLKPVGSGPYLFDRFKQNNDGSLLWYRLRRNKEYHREGPYLDTITFFFFKEEDAMVKALQKGTVDGFGPVTARRLETIGFSKSKMYPVQMPRIFGLFFNQKQSPLLADKGVREAIAFAVDRNLIAKIGTSGGASATYAPIPFHTIGIENPYPFDADRAMTLLEKSGWHDTDGDGIREKKTKEKGEEITTPLAFTLATSDWPDLIRTAELVKQMLRAVGIDVAIEKRPFSELESTVIRPRNFQILLFGQVYGYEEDPFAFWHSSQARDPGLNITLYNNKKADSLLENTRHTIDTAPREEKLNEISKILLQDIPAVFLYTQLFLYVLPADMKGVLLSQIALPADRFNEANKWHRDTTRVLR